MMGRAVPLLVDILVAAFAGVRLHEKLAGNFFSAVHLRGTGEKWAGGAIAFAVHGERWEGGILNASMLVPAGFAEIAGDRGHHRQQRQYGGDANRSMTGQPSASAQFRSGDQAHAEKTRKNVDVDERPLCAQRSGVN